MKHATLPGPRPLSRWACLAAVLASLAGGAAAQGWGPVSARNLGAQLASGDCSGAVQALNAGLAKASSEAHLLAGSMYEHGVCVRRDWSRAMGFYVQAHDGGQQAAAWRLAAGFAAPENGPDIAAALWWAGKARQELIEGCGVRGIDDPDRFVEQLRGWPKARLEQCNYAIGVMSTIVGEVQYPSRATWYGMEVDMTLRFFPAVPAVALEMGKSAQYEELGRPNHVLRLNERNEKRLAAVFADSVHAVARRAFKRYPQPPGIDPNAVLPLRLEFSVQD